MPKSLEKDEKLKPKENNFKNMNFEQISRLRPNTRSERKLSTPSKKITPIKTVKKGNHISAMEKEKGETFQSRQPKRK